MVLPTESNCSTTLKTKLARMPSSMVEPTLKSSLQPSAQPVHTWVNKGITPEEQKHIDACFIQFPEAIKTVAWEQYCLIHNSLGSQSANLFIATLDDKKWSKSNFSRTKDRLAAETKKAINAASNDKEALKVGRDFFLAEDLTPPVGQHFKGTQARMIDPDIWERKLKQRSGQRSEKAVRDKGRIFREGEVYSANYTVNRYIEMQKDKHAFLNRQQVISDEGDELSLASIAASTVANPSHRRHEMMTRMHGTEEFAKTRGLVCLFVTFTAASIYHPKRFIKLKQGSLQGQKGQQTEITTFKKSNGYFINNPHFKPILELKNNKGKIEKVPNTPKAAHAFIKRIMNRSIAQFKRENLDYMGYKVVEPHHDGTPHWHSALFVHPDDKQTISDILTHYALQEQGDEKGAEKHRIKIKDHDPKQGSVTGYMAKYISKGISGLDVGEDDETGCDAEESTIRLLAWKSLWGIRQFSFFGSSSVMVWRELRRIREPLENPILEQVRLAADGGHWDIFTQLMRANRITIKRKKVKDAEGQLKENKYYEVIQRIFGLKFEAQNHVEVIRTRFKEWFLVDLDKLEQRIIRGLPFQYREDPHYLAQIKNILKKAMAQKKVRRLYAGLGGVMPFSAPAPLGLVGNKVTGDGGDG